MSRLQCGKAEGTQTKFSGLSELRRLEDSKRPGMLECVSEKLIVKRGEIYRERNQKFTRFPKTRTN